MAKSNDGLRLATEFKFPYEIHWKRNPHAVFSCFIGLKIWNPYMVLSSNWAITVNPICGFQLKLSKCSKSAWPAGAHTRKCFGGERVNTFTATKPKFGFQAVSQFRPEAHIWVSLMCSIWATDFGGFGCPWPNFFSVGILLLFSVDFDRYKYFSLRMNGSGVIWENSWNPYLGFVASVCFLTNT